jgi:predicted SAM-dependent methyltransferase
LAFVQQRIKNATNVRIFCKKTEHLLTMNLLNIGCGSRFHPAWINIDLVAVSPHVRQYDLRKGLPFADNHLDACYSSHVLEHLTPEAAEASLSEQFRVLKHGGVVRVVVPDLEGIAREYLRLLEAVEADDSSAEANYDWMMMELYDQVLRTVPGGQMGAYLKQPQVPNFDFIVSRLGDEAELWYAYHHQANTSQEGVQRSLASKLRSKSLGWLVQNLRQKTASALVRLVAGRSAQEAFAEGLFRQSGEIHRWMYDRSSLRRLLERVGFREVRVCTATESRIPDFASYWLDTNPPTVNNGRVRKPDSLFIEAVKPKP